jgi:Streptomyces sporulation and cell division protein, SsgA
VVLVVAAKPEHPSLLRGRWVVLRDRLREVLAGAGGEAETGVGGNVRVTASGPHLTLTLRAAPLPCVVTVPAEPVRSFLAETDVIVPPGRERCQPALDAEIARMLNR